MALRERGPSETPRTTFAVMDKDGLVLCYPNAKLKTNVSELGINVIVEDSEGVITMREPNKVLVDQMAIIAKERDEARSEFLKATQSGKWEYSAELELQIAKMTAQIERMQTAWETLAEKNDDKAMRLEKLRCLLDKHLSHVEVWFAINECRVILDIRT